MKNKTPLIKALNQSLANTIDLKLQVKQAHWNVQGPHFLSLHELFDKIAAETDEYVDMLAERVRQLGGMAEGSLQMAAKASSLKAYPEQVKNSQQHLMILETAIEVVCEDLHKLIGIADKEDDYVTADLGTGVIRGLDKWRWFVESHLVGE